MSRALPILFALLCLASAACGDDSAGDWGGTGGSGGDPGEEAAWGGPGGPLANAGPDQRLLQGMPGRLDGRGSLRGEEGLELRYQWTQESGPRVALDDPTSPIAWFVAPPITGTDRKLVFRLTVDDGNQLVSDRVVVELVEEAVELLPAPVALAGADQEVLVDTHVQLAAPVLLDPACLLEGGPEGCATEAPLPFRWTQVEGPWVDLAPEGWFRAPAGESVLTFRLDAHRPSLEDETAACGRSLAKAPSTLCSAPDFVRVFVRPWRPGATLDQAPSASVLSTETVPQRTDTLPPEGGVLHLGSGEERFIVTCSERASPQGSPVARYGYRPLLGDPPLSGTSQQRRLSLTSRPNPPIDGLDRRWPGVQAVAYEARSRRLHAAPVPVLVSWEFPPGKALTARITEDPCLEAGACVPGERVSLRGGAVDPELNWCWVQTFGPEVTFEEGGGCLQGVPDRHFVAPSLPADGGELVLAFLLSVHDGGPLTSLPDTVFVRVRAPTDGPPESEGALPGESSDSSGESSTPRAGRPDRPAGPNEP